MDNIRLVEERRLILEFNIMLSLIWARANRNTSVTEELCHYNGGDGQFSSD